MRCIFCDNDILKSSSRLGHPVTLQGRGIAHSVCTEEDLVVRRIFGSIHIGDLNDSDLHELKDLVVSEINARQGLNEEVELF